jgi:tetratricopeptide (TPR) repeat protein
MSVTRSKHMRHWQHVLVMMLALTIGQTALAQENLRREIGTPLQQAQAQLRDGQNEAALQSLSATDALPNKTARELYWIEVLRAQIALKAGDPTRAVTAFRLALDKGEMSAQEREPLQAELLKARQLQVRTLYRAQQLDQVVTLMTQQDALEDQASLVLLAASYIKLKQESGYEQALERLLARYPSPAYWADRLARLHQQHNFAAVLGLELYRLQLAVGAISSPAEFLEMAILCQRAGYPVEALAVLDAGIKANVLKANDSQVSSRQERLHVMAREDKASISATAAKAQTSQALALNGWALATMGDYPRAIALLEKAVKAATAPAERSRNQLRLAHAQYLAGQLTDARATLQNVQGSDGTADLARLWTLHLLKATP